MDSFLPIRAFKDNYIWMLPLGQNTVCVVDPGDAQPVINTLSQHNYSLSAILLTHHHADHSGGISELLNHFGNIPVYASHHSKIKQISHFVKDKDSFQLGQFSFFVLEIPGHTLDHIAFYCEKNLFCGDTLFSAGCGRVFEGTAAQMYSSLQKLASLPDETYIFCGHEYTLANLLFAQHVEPNNEKISEKILRVKEQLQTSGCSLPSTLREERKINPFLRCEEVDVVATVEQRVEKKLTTIEVFHHLREWKNNFIAT